MRIGMILDKPFPSDVRVENEASTLIKAGHQVYLFCLDFGGKQHGKEQYKGIHVHRHSTPAIMYSLAALAYTVPFYHLALKKGIRQFIRQNAIEALHIHDIRVAQAVFGVNKRFGLPLVLDLHENRPEIMKHYYHVNTFMGKALIYPSIWKRFEKKFIREADKVIVVTQEALEYYTEHLSLTREKFVVLPNTVRQSFYTDVDVDHEIVRKYDSAFTILYWGDTGYRRGLNTVVKAMDHLIDHIPEIKLVFAGKSKSDKYLREAIIQSGHEQSIDLIGWQDTELFQTFIRASDICICPFHRNIHHDTTFANKIFQYLSLGKPVIVSNCTAQENLVTRYQCGLVFKDRDAQDFAKQVLKLYSDKNLYNRLGQNGIDMIRGEYNWEMTSKPLVGLYENL